MTKSKKDTPISQSIWNHGKVPPQAVDLEEIVLGGIMMDYEVLLDIGHLLHPELFYKESHQIICTAIKSLSSKHEPIDVLTVTNQLKTQGDLDIIGGPYYVTQLTNRVSSSVNTEHHLRIITQKFLAREVIRISSELTKEGFNDTTDIFDLISFATNQFIKLNEKLITDKRTEELSEVAGRVLEIIEKTRNDGFIPGIPSGLTSFDKVFHGFIAPDLIILASRPGMGKTSLITTICRNIVASKEGVPIALFSLEMDNLQLVQRMFLQEVDLTFMDMRKAVDLTDNQMVDLKTGLTKLEQYHKFYLDDTPAITPSVFRAKALKLVRKHGVKLIVIDYLQLMMADPDQRNKNREQEISSISRALKAISKSLNIPIIALAQLSRAVESRGGSKIPLLSDLRESGAIEQDADAVIFLFRPAYYKIFQDEDGNDCTNLAQLIIAKHRNGPTGIARLRFNDKRIKFENYEDYAADNLVLPITQETQPSLEFEDDIPF